MQSVGVELVTLVAVLGLARNSVVIGLVGRNDSAVLAKRRALAYSGEVEQPFRPT